MSKHAFFLSASLAAACFLVLPPARAGLARGLKSIPGHVPKIPTGLTPQGRLPATNELHLAIGLPLRDPKAVDDFLAGLYTPASTNFHQYLTPEQFAERFGPTADDYQAVISFAQTNGLVVTGTFSNRLLLDVHGPVANIERALHVSLLTYRHPTEARDFFAPSAEPSVDAQLAVADISGLDNYVPPQPRLRKMDPTAAAVVSPRAGSSPTGSYFGNDFRAAYLPGVTLTGTGQIVGLLEFDGFYANDITAYESAAGLPSVPLQTVLLDGYDGTPSTGGNGGNDEVSLDIEMAIAMAPGLSGLISFEAGPNGIPNDILNSMVTHPEVKQFSSSWGWGEDPVPPPTTFSNKWRRKGNLSSTN